MPQAGKPTPPAGGRGQLGGVLTVSAGHALHDSYTAFLPPLLPAFIRHLALSKTEAGLLSVFLQAPSFLQPFIGYLADRASLRYIVILAPAVTAMMMSLLGIAPAFGWLALALTVAGVSSAAMHAVGPVIAGRLSGHRLGRGMGFWMVGGELGRTLGPLLIVSWVRWQSLAGTPWLMLGGLAASFLLYLRLRHVTVRPPEGAPALHWREALRAMAPLLLPLSGIIVARAFLLSMLTTFFPTFLSDEGASLWLAGAALTILEAAGVVGALVGGSLSDRLGRGRILLLSMVTTPVWMIAFLLLDGWLRIPLLVLMGFCGLAVTPVIMALVQESYPENRALANGLYMSISFGLRAVVIVILGAIADLSSMRIAFLAGTLAPVLALPLLTRLPRRQS